MIQCYTLELSFVLFFLKLLSLMALREFCEVMLNVNSVVLFLTTVMIRDLVIGIIEAGSVILNVLALIQTVKVN